MHGIPEDDTWSDVADKLSAVNPFFAKSFVSVKSCVYVCINTYVCLYTDIYTYIYIHTYAYKATCIRTYIRYT